MLKRQLAGLQIPYINTALGEEAWSNAKKPSFILSALRQVKSKYVYILDNFDVLLCGDLSAGVKALKRYGVKVLFNATKNNYPNEEIDLVENRDTLGEFKYLNAGCCFGEKAALVELYEKVQSLVGVVENPRNSEQLLVRHAFNESQKYVAFDHECMLFQTFSGTRREVVSREERVVKVV
jgi:hypothetical protein